LAGAAQPKKRRLDGAQSLAGQRFIFKKAAACGRRQLVGSLFGGRRWPSMAVEQQAREPVCRRTMHAP
jgi:hypothetical protein